MEPSAVYRPHVEAPACASLSPIAPDRLREAWAPARAHRFELVSRGDRVPGMLFLPPETAPGAGWPLALVLHRAGGAKDSPQLDPAIRWTGAGIAVASLDLPLHGERRSAKLSARLLDGIRWLVRGRGLDPQTRVLVEEAARQGTSDAIRALDALADLEEIDADRLALVGLGVGAVVGCYVLAHDGRARCAALVGAGALREGGPLDPAAWLARTRTPHLRIVAPGSEARLPEAAVAALRDAAPCPVTSARHPTDGAWPEPVWNDVREELAKGLLS